MRHKVIPQEVRGASLRMFQSLLVAPSVTECHINCKTFEFEENLCFLSQSKHSKHTQHVIFEAVDSWGELTENSHHADVIKVAPPKDFHCLSEES